jgi:hypothetical protein
MKLRPAILAVLLVASSLTFTPHGEAQAGVGFVEGFEGMTPGTLLSGSWFGSYDSSSVGGPAGTLRVAATTLTGSQQALAFTPGTTNSYGAIVGQNRALDLCTTNSAFAFDVYLPAMANGQQLEFLVKGGAVNLASGVPMDWYMLRSVGFQVRGTGTAGGATVTPFLDGYFGTSAGGGQNMGTITTPGLFHVQITNQVCTSIQTRMTLSWGSLSAALIVNRQLTAVLNNFYIHADGGPYATTYVDNLAWTGLTPVPRAANFEDFRNYTLGTTPSKPFYSFSTAKGTGPVYPGILDCTGLNPTVSAQLASRCAYVPPASTQTFQSLSGELCPVQIDPTGSSNLPGKFGFDFAIGQATFTNNGWSQIQVLDNVTAPRNSITLKGLRVSDGTMAPQVVIVANGQTVLDATYSPGFNPFYDHLSLLCKRVNVGAGYHNDMVALLFDSHQAAVYGKEFKATDSVQSIFTAPLQYLVAGNLNCNGCGATQLDNLEFPSELTSSVHTSLPVVGMAVDPFGQSVILRTAASAGQDILSLDPYNLQVAGTYHEANCNRLGGVATLYAMGKVFASFLDCDSGNNVNVIHIRNQNLGPPDYSGTPCQGATFCDSDVTGPIGASGGDAPPGNARDLGSIAAAPWDYSLGSTEPDCTLCVRHVTMAWAFSEINGGHVGVYAITMNNNLPDEAATVTQIYAPAGSVINDFCAWRDTVTKRDYIAAVRSDGPTRIYQVLVKEEKDGWAHKPVVSLTQIFPGNGGFDNAASIGCARDRVLVVTNDGRAVLANVNGQVLATWSAAGPAQHSAAMSLDGAFGVYGAAGVYHIVDLVNRTEALQFSIPAGNLLATSLDYNAKTLWSGTNPGPHKFNLGALLKTQGVPLGSNRNLTGGGLLPCTDAQGNPSSTCTGNADPLPTSTGTSTGTSTSSTSSTSTGSGTNATETSSNSTSSDSNTTGGGGGGGGGVTSVDPRAYLWIAAAVVIGAAIVAVLILSRRRLKS